MRNEAILAVDAGGTSFKFSLLNCCSLDLLGEQRFYPISNDWTKEQMLGVFRNLFSDAINQAESLSCDIPLAAFSVPGPFDCKRGVSLMKHKWPSLKDVELVDEFKKMSVLPNSVKYSFIHDVNAFLLGEKMCGKAIEANRVAAVVIGTGVGFALWNGSGFIVDETGHPKYGIYKFPFRAGTLEDYVSGRGIAKLYKDRTGIDKNGKEIEDAARHGDIDALSAYSEFGEALGTVIGPIIKEYEIEAVAVGGRISLAFDLFKDSMQDTIGLDNTNLLIYPSNMLETAAMKGAASWGKRIYNL